MSFLTKLREAARRLFIARDSETVALGSRAEATHAPWSAKETRIARIVVAAATLWFVLAASWELFGPILAGHFASSASMGIIAENMHRWGIAGPVWSYTNEKPTPDLYYCHHPWGIFWTTRFYFEVFGRHDFVCRLPAVVLSAITPPLLSAVSRALYRPYAGAATAVAFVVLPITLSFASFNALEVPVIAYSALFLWGYVRLTESSKRRYLVASLVGAFLALNADWPAFVVVGVILAVELVRMLSVRVAKTASLERRRAQHWALTATVSVVTLVVYLHLFSAQGKLSDLLGSYGMRSSGNEATLSAVLHERRYWIELMFTPVAIFLGKLFAVVAVVRFFITRRAVEIVPLAVLVMASFQYVIFKQGADIHVFWPHYFAPYFALAMGGLVATSACITRRLFEARWPRVAAQSGLVTLAFAAIPLGFVLRDGADVLVYAHRTGGRMNEKGLRIESSGDKVALLHWLAPEARVIGLHESMNANWADVWALGGRTVPLAANPPPIGSDAVTVVDVRFVPDATKANLLQMYGVTAVGPFWALRATVAPPRVLSFVETEPSLLESYFVSGTEPHREIARDPYAAWELYHHYGITAPLPEAPAQSFEEHRVRHNIALFAGDVEGARAERDALMSGCRVLDVTFSEGTKLVCARFHEGASDTLTIVFEPSGPLTAGVELSLTSRVTHPGLMSTTMVDPTIRESSFPFSLAPSRFSKGFLYSHVIVIRPRPGREVFDLAWNGRGAPSSERPVEVLRL